MATNNAINTNIPIDVADGGTGSTTLTDNGVLVGSGTSAITPITVGTTGQLLRGVASSDPIFDDELAADFTFIGSDDTNNIFIAVENTDNTSLSSSATIEIRNNTQTTTTGDVNMVFYEIDGVGRWEWRMSRNIIDVSPLILGNNGAITYRVNDETYSINSLSTPVFIARNSTTRTNVTGDGTQYSVIFNTEITDQGADYNPTTGVFTAPITGHYILSVFLNLNNVTSGHTLGTLELVTSNNTFYRDFNTFLWAGATSTECAIMIQVLCDMDTSDTASVDITVSNSTLTVGLTNVNAENVFSGFLQG